MVRKYGRKISKRSTRRSGGGGNSLYNDRDSQAFVKHVEKNLM